MVRGKTWREKSFDVINTAIMILLVVVSVYPLYYALINSLNDGQDITNYGLVLLWPRVFTLESWRTVLGDASVVNALLISFSRTVIVTVLSTLITTMFAYAFSRSYLRGRKFYAALGFISMYLNGGIIATFLLISALGLYNNYLVYILPSLFGGFYNVIIYTSNFKAIPEGLYESAKLDGASEFQIYSRLVLPLSRPVIAALAVFTVVGVWNDYQTTLFYTDGTTLKTLQYYIVQIVHNASALEALKTSSAAGNAEIYRLLQDAAGPTSSKTIELAAMLIASVPMILIYPFAQKNFTQGMMIGSIKG
ncbi:MAG TPA: carbohydrate ABC transporter permease [Candidatus Eisenbergiella merdavium]|uniref:Carbohydrate ABC transporter permease n=1 Tax=Candidatus Eisenbergiella merdavium TaxID=2838551 RepID=A0A9D2NKU4_9FIRM|nr:carbohydrate ABC transporter permease [Candidatus Eisenbergiella merdavium]